MIRCRYYIAICSFVSFSLPSGLDVRFAPGFLERGPQQAADRTDIVILDGNCSVSRNEPHAQVIPSGSKISVAKMSEFQPPPEQRRLYKSVLSVIMTTFMKHFWPWWVERMGRTYIGELVLPNMDLTLTDIGGPNDLAATEDLYETDPSNALAFGISRGAGATFIALANLARTSEKLPKAAVLESPYGQFDEVRPSGVGGWLADIVHPRDLQCDAITYVKQYPQKVPTLFVTSVKDDKVPYSSTQRLAKAVANAGHKNVFLLVLQNSLHKNYTWGNQTDIQVYQGVSNAFYKQYGIPHDAQSAQGVDLEDYRVRADSSYKH
jgi:hypothetical protein